MNMQDKHNMANEMGQHMMATPSMAMKGQNHHIHNAIRNASSPDGGSGGHSMMIMMMYFNNKMPFHLLFDNCRISNKQDLAIAVFIVFLVAVLYEGLRIFRENMLHFSLMEMSGACDRAAVCTTSSSHPPNPNNCNKNNNNNGTRQLKDGVNRQSDDVALTTDFGGGAADTPLEERHRHSQSDLELQKQLRASNSPPQSNQNSGGDDDDGNDDCNARKQQSGTAIRFRTPNATSTNRSSCHCKIRPVFTWRHLVQSLLHALQVFISYALMLAVMTFNSWLMAAVVLGAGFGHVLFAWRRRGLDHRAMMDHCH